MIENSFTFRCGIKAKNRAVLAPLTNGQSPGGVLSEDEFCWLKARVQGGFGLITSCATHVMREAQAWDGQLAIFADEHTLGWRRLAEMADSHHALLIPQLFHGGFRCPSRLTGVQPTSASVVQLDSPDFEVPRALEDSEIVDIQDKFVQAAERAIKVGLTGVELHGANGYLFTQFLSTTINRRVDRWGGSFENRSRFLLDTVRSVRRAIGPNKILGVRISPEDTKLISGLDIDESLELAQELSASGVDYISLSLWSACKTADKYVESKETVLQRFRRAIPEQTALTVAGQIWTADDVKKCFVLGADLVAVGGAGIANPNWPLLLQHQPLAVQRLPLTRAQLSERAVSDRFMQYLGRWNFVASD